MRRRDFFLLSISAALATKPLLGAGYIRRIGVLGIGSRQTNESLLAAFRQGLAALGWSDEDLAVVDRWADDRAEELSSLAAELVASGVDLLVTIGTPATLAARNATVTMPIVFVGVGDPVSVGAVHSLARPGGNATGLSLSSLDLIAERFQLLQELLPGLRRVAVILRDFALGDDPIRLGFVASLNRPGGNITGVSFLTTELVPKRMELLRELEPGIATVAYALNPNNPGSEVEMKVVQTAARALGQQSVVVKIGSASEFDAVFASLAQQHVGGLIVGSGAFFFAQRDRLAALAAKHAIPAIYDLRDYVEAGGLMSYGASITDAYQQVGIYAGRILKGEKPADLPVEQPVRFELVINVKAGNALGLTIPQSLLTRADEVIE